jgi:biopolymer transport protein ExbD
MKTRSGEFQDEDVQHQNPLPIVPLIDCFVLILVFFLATASVTKPHKELQIMLPNSAAAVKTVSKADTLVIEITKDGVIYLESEPVSKTLLHKRLRQAAAEGPDRRVRVEADRQTAFQHLVYVMDMLQFEGLRNVGFKSRE